MGGQSQTQNVQRGFVMLFFFQVLILTIATIYRTCKNMIDPAEEEMEGEQYKENAARESQERIDAGPDFDKLAVKKESPPD